MVRIFQKAPKVKLGDDSRLSPEAEMARRRTGGEVEVGTAALARIGCASPSNMRSHAQRFQKMAGISAAHRDIAC